MIRQPKSRQSRVRLRLLSEVLKTKEILFTNYVANDELYNDSKINLPASDEQRQTD